MTIDWLSIAIGFGSGVGLAVVTALVTAAVERRQDRRKRREAARFDVYMKLLEINALYFWVASAEVHGEHASEHIREQLRELAWRTADRLREVDEVEYLEEILEVLLAETFDSAAARAEALADLIARLDPLTNPRYAQAIANVSKRNMAAIAAGAPIRGKAPGAVI